MPQVWCYNMASGVMQISAEFYLSHLLNGGRGGSGSGRDHGQKERQLETEWETDSWGEEVNWVGKTVENNLKLIWTLQMVWSLCVSTLTCVRLCWCQLVHLGLCIGINVCLCVLCYFRQTTSGMCTMSKFWSRFGGKRQKTLRKQTHILLAFGWLECDLVNVSGVYNTFLCVCMCVFECVPSDIRLINQ